MKMKKVSLVLCVVMVAAALAGCGGGGTGSKSNYIDVVSNARTAEQNDVFYVVGDADTRAGAESLAAQADSSASGEVDADEKYQQWHDMVFHPSTGFNEADMQRYAISIGFSITQAYGVAIVLPQQGKEQAVLDQLNNYVELQKSAMENYLADQYEIAKSAVVKTVKTGEVVMVMSEDAETVLAAIEAGLAG